MICLKYITYIVLAWCAWYDIYVRISANCRRQGSNFIAAIAAIAVEGEQNAVDHCDNDGNLLPYSAIFILFTVHYNNYFDTWIQMLIKSCVNHYISLSFLRKKTLKKYVDLFLACQKSKVTIKLKFYYSNLKNAVETAKIAVDSYYVPQQFLTPLPSIDFREIRGLVEGKGLLYRNIVLSSGMPKTLIFTHTPLKIWLIN